MKIAVLKQPARVTQSKRELVAVKVLELSERGLPLRQTSFSI